MPKGPDPEGIIASYDGDSVTVDEFMVYCTDLMDPDFLKYSVANETDWARTLVYQVVNSELIAKTARAEGADQDEEFKQWRDNMLRKQMMQNYTQDHVYRKVSVTEKDIQRKYEFRKHEYLVPASFRFNQVWVDISKWGRQQARERILKAHALLVAGDELDAVLTEYSDRDHDVKYKPLGDYAIGEIPYKQMERAVLETPINKFSDIIETPLGFHIVIPVKVTEPRTKTIEEVREELYSELLEEKIEKTRAKLIKRLSKKIDIDYRPELLKNSEVKPSELVLRVRDRVVTIGEFRAVVSKTHNGRSEKELLETMRDSMMIHAAAIEADYQDIPEFKEDMRAHENDTLSRQFLDKKGMEQATVSEEEIDDFYENRSEHLYREKEIEPYQIYLLASMRPDMKSYEKIMAMEEVKARLTEIREEIKQGLPFSEAARLYSDASSGARGGAMTRRSWGTGRRFDNIAFTLEEGEISEPVEMYNGYQLIWARKVYERHLPEKEEAREEIIQRLKEWKAKTFKKEYIEELREATKIEIDEEMLDAVSDHVSKFALDDEIWMKL